MKDASRWAGIYRGGGIGDNLIASSVLPGLKKKYGNVEVITSRTCHVVFENNPYIDKLSVRDAGDPPGADARVWQEWFHSRAKDYKFFANLSHSCETLGAFFKAQTYFWWNQNMRRKMAGRSYLELVHDICEIPYDEINPNFYPTAKEHAHARKTKAKVGPKVIGWVLSGSRLDKIHPHADVAVVRLLKELKLPIIMFGSSPRDFELAKLILKAVEKHDGSHKGLHLALSPDPAKPTWPIRRALTQIQHCDLVIGPDTGLMWAVAMHDMPKVMMVSHASAENITKHWKNATTLQADPKRVPCHPCHRLHDDSSTCVPNADNTGAACMTDISVDEIVSTVKKLLKG